MDPLDLAEMKRENSRTPSDVDIEYTSEENNEDNSLNIESSAVDPLSLSIKIPFECNDCGKTFKRKCRMASHLKQHRHKCPKCPRTFSLIRYLKTHVENAHRINPFKCNECEYTSNNKSTVKNHFIRCHTSGYEHSCGTCRKQFKIKKDLTNHVKNHHTDAAPIVCAICGHLSKNIRALDAHIRYRHYKPDFVCNICTRGMTTKEKLEQHLTWHETKEKVSCPTCGKSFRGRDLDSHMRIHTGAKPFPCPVCGKTFRRQSAQEHHVLIHTGKKSYFCDICGKAFIQKAGLITHRKKHLGPLPPLPKVSVKNLVTDFLKQYANKNKDHDNA